MYAYTILTHERHDAKSWSLLYVRIINYFRKECGTNKMSFSVPRFLLASFIQLSLNIRECVIFRHIYMMIGCKTKNEIH